MPKSNTLCVRRLRVLRQVGFSLIVACLLGGYTWIRELWSATSNWNISSSNYYFRCKFMS